MTYALKLLFSHQVLQQLGCWVSCELKVLASASVHSGINKICNIDFGHSNPLLWLIRLACLMCLDLDVVEWEWEYLRLRIDYNPDLRDAVY